MSVKLLIEHHLEFLSLKGGYRCSSESTLVRNLMQRLNYFNIFTFFFRFVFHLAAWRNAPLACTSVI